mgnify:CR=1 FL=1
MNSKGHLFISLGKSAIRVIGGIVTLVNDSIIPLAVGIIVAEVGGVLEELVDVYHFVMTWELYQNDNNIDFIKELKKLVIFY